MKRASKYSSYFGCFPENAHIIPDDDDGESASSSYNPPDKTVSFAKDTMDAFKPSTQQSFTPSPTELNNSKMRELNMCQPCSVPHNDTDFDPIKYDPVPKEFKISASPPSHT